MEYSQPNSTRIRGRKRPQNQYDRAVRQCRSVGLSKCCVPIAMMILLDLPFRAAVSACAVHGNYRGCGGGTRSRRVLRTLGIKLVKIPKPEWGVQNGRQLKDLKIALHDGSFPQGRFLVRSRRIDPERGEVSHASAIVDGQLLDGRGSVGKPFNIIAIYRVTGKVEQARMRAKECSSAIREGQQPLARGSLGEFCKLFARRHGLANTVAVEFRQLSGRKKRADTVVQWYPLQLARQQRASPSSNVSSLVRMIHGALATDLGAARPCLTRNRGIRIHGNTHVESVRPW